MDGLSIGRSSYGILIGGSFVFDGFIGPIVVSMGDCFGGKPLFV